MKKLIIPESELTNIIQKAVGKKLIEQDFSVEPKIGKTPRESELEDVFGKYSGTEIKVDGEELLVMKEEDIMGIVE